MLGCNEVKVCNLDENRKLALVTFYIQPGEQADTLIFNRVISDRSPYFFYSDLDTLLGAAFFPLNPEEDFTDFELETDSLTYDLSFTYQREFSVYNTDCDPSIRFFDLTGTSEIFDSVAIINPILNREQLINVEAYF